MFAPSKHRWSLFASTTIVIFPLKSWRAGSLSVSALERRFKAFSETPNQFINEVRLENARKLLVETRLPVSQVAYSGFPEPSYFTKQFRRLFGEIPRSYARNCSRAIAKAAFRRSLRRH